MAEAPPHPPARRGGPLGPLTQKAGPLPVWAWVGLALVAFFLYRRLHPSTPSTGGGPAPTDQSTFVPGFDAGALGGGGGIGDTTVPAAAASADGTSTTESAQSFGGGTTSAVSEKSPSPSPTPDSSHTITYVGLTSPQAYVPSSSSVRLPPGTAI